MVIALAAVCAPRKPADTTRGSGSAARAGGFSTNASCSVAIRSGVTTVQNAKFKIRDKISPRPIRTYRNFEFPLRSCSSSYDAQVRTYNPGVQDDSNQRNDRESRQKTGRLLALDVGSRTIGLAVSDPLGITAQGLPTIRRASKRVDLQRLADLIRQYEVAEIVVGYPLHMSGERGAQAQKVEALAAEMRRRFHLPVHLWDERLTSAEANRVLRETDMSIQRRGQVVDQLAAVLILQAFMQNRSSLESRPSE